MVYQICVINGKDFKMYQQPIISLHDYANGNLAEPPQEYVEYFDSMTSNFNDLDIWNDYNDLYGKNAVEVANRLKTVLTEMTADGYTEYQPTPDQDLFMTWQFGHYKIPNSCIPGELPSFSRHCILLYHLERLLKIAEQYDETFYFYTNNDQI